MLATLPGCRRLKLTLVLVVTVGAGLNVLRVEADSDQPSTESGQTLWQWQERYVRLAPQATEGALPNDHPVSFTPLQVGAMLSALRVDKPEQRRLFAKDQAAENGVPVFSEHELEVLSETISRGLAQAGPREDVVFLTVGNYDYALGGVIKKREANAGRLFYRDGQLNIIFGTVHGELKGPRGAGSIVVYPPEIPEPGVRQPPPSTTPDWQLRLAPGMELYHAAGSTRGDWVLIEPAVAVANYEQRQRERVAQPDDKGAPVAVMQEMSRITEEQDKLRQEVEQLQQQVQAEERTTRTATDVPAERPAPTPTTAVAPTSRPAAESLLEQRLQRLKELKDKGLISEEIYTTKVNELLEKEGL